MTNELFVDFLSWHILKLFPNSSLGPIREKENQRDRVSAKPGGTEIMILLPQGDLRLGLLRSQVFSSLEKRFLERAVDHLYSMDVDILTDIVFFNLYESLLPRIVAESIDSDPNLTRTLAHIIAVLEKWSSETYEGQRIAASFLINPGDVKATNVMFSEYIKLDLAKVLSNGLDSFTHISSRGYVVGHVTLPRPLDDSWMSPRRYCAASSVSDIFAGSVSVILNRIGEILIFRKNALVFTKRRGGWQIYNHQSTLRQLAFGSKYFDSDLRKAMYATALDVSFSRTGGLIAFIKDREIVEIDTANLISKDDLMRNKHCVKGKLFSKIAESKFSRVPRTLRQEIVGIDGSTVIGRERIIAIGAIVKIRNRGTSGGRAAAAETLSKYGVALKISSDGIIGVYHDEEEAFRFA